MTQQKTLDTLGRAAAAIRRHDKEEGICSAMCEGQTVYSLEQEDLRSHDRVKAVALIEEAKTLLKRSWV